ncbi:lytic murein transglycosylase [Xenophilus sp. Marseille-Q4582]|uniref:lytic murein transglycosylase n=1 Tax=Xenophilus sp. Marseille-Q4582 TaxID=2866600 RepID=UPI001CE47DDA|nr:lytic murein transglycosylase [Xenophilus sp. Marseille-Q4582]
MTDRFFFPRAWPACGALVLGLAGCAAPGAGSPTAPAAAPAAPTLPAPPAPSTAPAPVPAPAVPAAPAAAPDVAAQAQAQAFAQWVAQFRAEARAAGIAEGTLHSAFDGVQLRPDVIARDRSQAEFTRAVWDYLDTAASDARVARGQQRLQEWRSELDAAAARHGVPAEIVAAIWGMESNYGANYGDVPTIDALATLGFDGRRGPWARGQLMAALRILQNGDIPRERMIGSWAGAMGQTQFLPSVFLAHAVDADGDGRRDIWGSMPDVIASTANFLRHEGWQPGQPWGVEVQLPPGFDVARADGELRQSAAQWAAEGVRRVDGAALPDLPDAALLLPAGARGPAFLVGANFRTLLRYNNATSYALGVGLLAQRLAGGPGVQAAWPRELTPLRREEVRALQQALHARGFDSGTPDGVVGRATRAALRAWQRSAGLPPDGYPTVQLLEQLTAPR